MQEVSIQKMKSVRLRAKEERRFKQGHPWVFSNELQESPKALQVGEVIELCDAGGVFLAYGFANPHSLISFRELSRNRSEAGLAPGHVDSSFFLKKIEQAWSFRKSWFPLTQSFRLVYGEADGLSGLIIDRFAGRSSVVYVVQPHAAGMDANLDSILSALGELSFEKPGTKRFAVLRRDASSREREGLAKEPVRVVAIPGKKDVVETEPFRDFRFVVSGIMGSELELSCDLIGGQKTGFFFDQLQNIRLLETLLLRKLRNERGAKAPGEKTFRVLDLCSYAGQWSAHLLQTLSEREMLPAEFTCVDASEPALGFASRNLLAVSEAMGVAGKVRVEPVKADVLREMPGIEARRHDVVIADPPAFIKNRKSIPQGKQAYVQLFGTAIEKTAPGGLVVFCSCSQLLSREDFLEVIAKAGRRSKRTVRFLAEGSPSFDHFSRPEFGEGQYLKCLIAQVEEHE